MFRGSWEVGNQLEFANIVFDLIPGEHVIAIRIREPTKTSHFALKQLFGCGEISSLN
jgi:hypothetical protein